MNTTRLTHLLNEERMGAGTGPGPHNENTVQGLIDLCNFIPSPENMKMVEIGCYLGVSTEVFCLHFKEVIGIDTWGLNHEKYHEANWSAERIGDWETIKNLCHSRLIAYPNCKLIHDVSEKIACTFRAASLDFVYIDGNHAQVHVDINNWLPKIKNGGYIGGHDYEYIKDIISEKTKLDTSKFKIFKETSWLCQK